MSSLAYVLLQLAVTIAVAPLVNGIIKKIKALSQKRRGAPVWQMYFDLYKLFQKESVISDVSSWIFNVTPYIVLGSALVAALMVPFSTRIMPLGFPGDLILLVYLLALGKFFMALAGLDTGSTFGGMGSSREVMIWVITEPAFLVSLLTVGLMAKSSSVLQIMLNMQNSNGLLSNPALIMIFLALFITLIAETSRLPVDDPATHLELTMVHEAMILEYSGRQLAMMEMAAAVKQLIFISLLVNIFLPHDQLLLHGIPALLIIGSLLIYIAKVAFAALLISITEISTVKLGLFSVPNLAALSFILSFIGFLQLFVIGR